MNKGGISARLVPCPVASTTVDVENVAERRRILTTGIERPSITASGLFI